MPSGFAYADLIGIALVLVFTAVVLYALWGVIRSAVLSALRAHDAERRSRDGDPPLSRGTGAGPEPEPGGSDA